MPMKVLLCLACWCSAAFGQQLEVLQVQPNLYMIAGAGGNVAVQIGPDGVLVVDTGSANLSEALLAEIRKLTPQPVRYIINTSADADHVGGNERLSKASGTPVPAVIIAAENVLNYMSAGKQPAYGAGYWPTDTFFQKQKAMYFNREGIQILAQPGAHSDANAIVFFRRSDVIVAGDVFDPSRFPVIDVAKGGNIDKEIAALNFMIELAIPSIPMMWQEGGTAIIPGHGWLVDQADLVEYRDMVTIVRDRVRFNKSKGMTLEQVKAANPVDGYRARYGEADAFIEAIYKTVGAK